MYLWGLALLLCFSTNMLMAHQLSLPRQAFGPENIAIIINDNDPLSINIGQYYQRARGISKQHVIHIKLPPGKATISKKDFLRAYHSVIDVTPPSVQAYALTWTRPYRVECQSITTAFASGFDPAYCAVKNKDAPCGPSGQSPYYNSESRQPHADFNLRPAMVIAANTFDQAKALIDRGIASDGTNPTGTAYLLKTSDKNRNVRVAHLPQLRQVLANRFAFNYLEQDVLSHKEDVFFYTTGATRIGGLDSLKFLPGAAADHLTSAGGIMPKDNKPLRQMSSLRWLEAGATGSYGTVIEPCNYLQKFPNPAILARAYINGQTLIEAYWKSVAWPGEGIFIGEPLARPFNQDMITIETSPARLKLWSLAPGVYSWEESNNPIGPYNSHGQSLTISYQGEQLITPKLKLPYYRMVLKQEAPPFMH